MTKHLLAIAASAAMCLGAMAQDEALNFYAVGQFQGWNPAEGVAFEKSADGVYTLAIEEEITSLKVSTTLGSWDDFNANAIVNDGEIVNKEWGLYTASNGNIDLPWKGVWTIDIDPANTKIRFSTETPAPAAGTYPAVYLRGTMNGWGAEEAWQFATTNGVTYVLDHVALAAVDEQGKKVEWKVADDSWGKINYGTAEKANYPIGLDVEAVLQYNSPCNCVLGVGGEDLKFTFDLPSHTLLVTANAGLGQIDVLPAPAEYYNLQGVRIDNPGKGFYIIKQAGKAEIRR